MGCCCTRSEEPIIFPEPQGPYSVGCADIMTDATENDKGIFIRLFYPTDRVNIKHHISELAPSVPEPAEKYMNGFARVATPCCFCLVKCLIKNQLEQCYSASSSALWQAPIATDGGPFRLVVISAGFSGFRTNHCVFSANLASHGFIVATIEQRADACYTYTLTSDGEKEEYSCHAGVKFPVFHMNDYDRYFENNKEKVIPWHKLVDARIKEIFQALELFDDMSKGKGCFEQYPEGRCIVVGQELNWKQFSGRITLKNAALLGYSLGGTTSVAAMAACPQFSYFIHFDPQMFMVDDRYYSEMQQIRPCKALFFIQDMQNKRTERGKLALMIKAADHFKCEKSVFRILKTNHLTYSDTPYFRGCCCKMMSGDPIPVEIFQPIVDDMVLALLTDDNEKMNQVMTKFKDHIVLEQ